MATKLITVNLAEEQYLRKYNEEEHTSEEGLLTYRNVDYDNCIWNEGFLSTTSAEGTLIYPKIQIGNIDFIGYIGDGVFQNSILKNITPFYDILTEYVPNGFLTIKKIGKNAFSDCIKFEGFMTDDTQVSWSKGLKITDSIGESAFKNCSKWKLLSSQKIYIDKNVKLGAYAFENCAEIDFYDKLSFDGYIHLNTGIFKGTDTRQVLLSDNIPDECYSNCKRLGKYIDGNVYKEGSITIPQPITYIGNKAFEGCSGILEVDLTQITSSQLTIGNSCFKDSLQLETIHFPSGIKELYINSFAFENCDLGTLSFPSGLTTLHIGEGAFKDCDGLMTIIFPSTLETLIIEPDAFRNCTNLKSIEINAKSSITIKERVFHQCTDLTKIKIISENQLTIANWGFNISASQQFPKLPIIELQLKGKEMSIGDNLGVNLDTLETLGADFVTVKNICGSMNRDNNKLKNLYIYQKQNYSNTLKETEGFKNLSKLTNIYLANHLGINLGPGALKNCTSLRKITTLDDTTVIASDQFYINPSLQIEFGSLCFNHVLSNNTTDVTSITFPKLNGVPDGSNLLNHCFGHLKINTAAEEGITFNLHDTKIPKNCFSGSNIKTLNVLKDLSEIQDGAFEDCTLLEAIKPIEANTFNSLSYIGENCFDNTALKVKDTTNKHWYVKVGDKRVYTDSTEGENSTIVSPECDLVAKAAVRPEVTDITCAFIGNKRIHAEAFIESKLNFIFKNNIYNLKNLTLKTKEGETIKLYSSSLHPALQNLRNATKLLILSPVETFGVCPFSYDINIETLEFGTDEKVINVPDNFCSRKIAIQNLILNSKSVGTSSFTGLTGSLPYLKINTNSKLHFAHRAFYSDDLVIRTLDFNKEIEDWMKNVTVENKTSSPIPYVLKFKTPKYPDGVFRIAPAAELTPQSYTLSNNKFINEIDFTNLKATENNKGSLSGLALIHIYGPIATARGLIEETFNLKLDNSPKGKIYKDGEWGDVV